MSTTSFPFFLITVHSTTSIKFVCFSTYAFSDVLVKTATKNCKTYGRRKHSAPPPPSAPISFPSNCRKIF